MHVVDLANTCGSVARGLVQAYVRGCEAICTVHDTPAPEPAKDKGVAPANVVAQVARPVDNESYRMVGRII